jgi:hypothetical protein
VSDAVARVQTKSARLTAGDEDLINSILDGV